LLQKNGSLVLAKGPADEAHLAELKARGEKNGVQNLRIIDKKELFEMEPYVHPDCTAALYAPDAGNLIPYEFTIALFENAVQNGVEVRIRREVVDIKSDAASGLFEIKANHWEPKTFLQNSDYKPSNGPVNGANGHADREELLRAAARKRVETSQTAFTVSIVVGAIGASASSLANVDFLKTSVPLIGRIILFLLIASVVYTAVVVVLSSSKGGKDKSKPSADAGNSNKALPELVSGASQSVGSGGDRISIDQSSIGGSGAPAAVDGQLVEVETIRARYIVNAAGSGSDKVANMIGDKSFYIKPRVGDYVLLNKSQGENYFSDCCLAVILLANYSCLIVQVT
jgi:hypothetical protein